MSRFARPVFVAMLLAGCQLEDVDDLSEALPDEGQPTHWDDPEAELRAGAGPVATTEEGCAGARQIAMLHDSSDVCAFEGLPAGWFARRMFENGSPELTQLDALVTGPVPDELARFCAYVYNGENAVPSADELAALDTEITNSGLFVPNMLAPDCRGQKTQATQAEGLGATSIDDEEALAFKANTHVVPAFSLATAARTPVEVAVLDTVPRNLAGPPTNGHGLAMKKIIRRVICPADDPSCFVANPVHNRLAMPILSWDDNGPHNDYDNGGTMGSVGDLAMSIYAAVRAWRHKRETDPTNTAPRLVLSQSIGYMRGLDGTELPSQGPDKALHAALQYASCNGVLLVAAAGNKPEPACDSTLSEIGPLAPGSREVVPAPDAGTCADLGFDAYVDDSDPPSYAVFGPSGAYSPLVHAVAGVDEGDRWLVNTRDGARPRLAALGNIAMGNMVGSSAATAVVAGTASLIWSYRPELSAPEVMDIIHGAGFPLGETAEFGLTEPLPPIHRVSVCSALEAACAVPSSHECPDLTGYCPALAPATDGGLASYFAEVDAVIEALDAASVVDTIAVDVTPEQACVSSEQGNLADPQPDFPVCSTCNLSVEDDDDPAASGNSVGYSVNMTIKREFYGTVESVGLLVQDINGDTNEYSLGVQGDAVVNSLNAQQAGGTEVTRVPIVLAAPAEAAALIFTVTTAEEQSDEQIAVQRVQ